MTKLVSLHELAELELNDAADFYDSKQTGLGRSFILEVQQAVLQIKEHPESAKVVRANARRKVLRQFPYNVIYSITTPIRFVFSRSPAKNADLSIGAVESKEGNGEVNRLTIRVRSGKSPSSITISSPYRAFSCMIPLSPTLFDQTSNQNGAQVCENSLTVSLQPRFFFQSFSIHSAAH